MSEIEDLQRNYERFVRLPWDRTLAGPQKVWFVIYEPAQERRLRLRVEDFAAATTGAAHRWKLLDLTDAFAQWMAGHEYKEAYFENPEDLDYALDDEFRQYLADQVRAALISSDVDDNTVVALLGVGSLFGLARVSVLLEDVAAAIKGRLLVFFPGSRDGSNYRLLDARDGWNYLAIPITATEEK